MESPTGLSAASQNPAQFPVELPSQQQGENRNVPPLNTQFHSPLPQIPSWKPFSIVTENDSLSSGFPYTSRLRDLRVTPDQWLQFTTEIINAAKITVEDDAAAWAVGVTTGTLALPLLLVFGPMAGYYAGKSIHRKAVAKNARQKLGVEGPLRATLRQWNERVFMGLGIQLWLEPPIANSNGDFIVDAPADATPKEYEKAKKEQAKRFRFICMPHDPRNAPMGTDYSSTSPSESESTWSVDQSPVSPEATTYVNSDGRWERMKPLTAPVEVSGVRPVAELGVPERKPVAEVHVAKRKQSHRFLGSKIYEMDGGSPVVPAKEEKGSIS